MQPCVARHPWAKARLRWVHRHLGNESVKSLQGFLYRQPLRCMVNDSGIFVKRISSHSRSFACTEDLTKGVGYGKLKLHIGVSSFYLKTRRVGVQIPTTVLTFSARRSPKLRKAYYRPRNNVTGLSTYYSFQTHFGFWRGTALRFLAASVVNRRVGIGTNHTR